MARWFHSYPLQPSGRVQFRPGAAVDYERMFDAPRHSTGPPALATAACEAPEPSAAPRGRARHDKSYDGVMAAPRGRDMSRDDLSAVATRIEDRIDELEREIAAIAPLVRERTRLLRARALLRGEPAPDPREPVLRPRITREDVFDYLTRNPGSRPGEIAAGLGTGQGTVSAHLYRGKGRLFSTRGGRWYPLPAE